MASAGCNLLYYYLVFVLGTQGLENIHRFGTKTKYESSIAGWYRPNRRPPPSLDVSSADFVNRRWPEFCSPLQLNGLIRHGIRNVGRSDINHFLSAVKKLSTNIGARNRRLVSTLTKLAEIVTAHEAKCLLPEGREEQKYLARRLYNTYRTLLADVGAGDFRLTISSSPRTRDSCLAFMEGMLPKVNVSELVAQLHVNDALIRFFDRCPKYIKEVDEREEVSLYEYYAYQKDNFNKVSEKISKRLHLNEEQSLSKKELKALFIMSATEVAVLNTSELLTLFDEEDISILEYAMDLKNYWKKSYGHEINYKQSCLLLADVFVHLENAVKNDTWYKAVLRFGHAETLLPLLALLDLFKDEVKLRAGNQSIHADRKFRTSIISPFSANVIFVLHRCEETMENGIIRKIHKVQVTVNEMPVVIPGCEGELCLYETFQGHYKDIVDSCNFDHVCKLHDHEEL